MKMLILCTLTCDYLDVAFDILYVGDTSVIHQSLKERHELLQKVVNPLKGCLEILVPNRGLNAHRNEGKNAFRDFRICLCVCFSSQYKSVDFASLIGIFIFSFACD